RAGRRTSVLSPPSWGRSLERYLMARWGASCSPWWFKSTGAASAAQLARHLSPRSFFGSLVLRYLNTLAGSTPAKCAGSAMQAILHPILLRAVADGYLGSARSRVQIPPDPQNG